jgi:hypothetical protein
MVGPINSRWGMVNFFSEMASSMRAALKGQLDYSGLSMNHSLQNSLQVDQNRAERRRDPQRDTQKWATKMGSALLVGLPESGAGALKKHYDGRLPDRDPWGFRRRVKRSKR